MVMGTLIGSSNSIFVLHVNMYNVQYFFFVYRCMYVDLYVGCSDVRHGGPKYCEIEQREKTSCTSYICKLEAGGWRLDFVKRR